MTNEHALSGVVEITPQMQEEWSKYPAKYVLPKQEPHKHYWCLVDANMNQDGYVLLVWQRPPPINLSFTRQCNGCGAKELIERTCTSKDHGEIIINSYLSYNLRAGEFGWV